MADLINGLFEVLGGWFILLNIFCLHRDKQVRGYSLVAVTYFTLWGYWNMYFYPSLDQIMSTIGGGFIAVLNTVWLVQTLHYIRKEKHDKATVS